MTLAVVMSRALDGMDAPPVQVEVHLANGLPSFTLVGLADTEVKEARERVRAALLHFQRTNESPSIWRRPSCRKTLGASICRSRSASSPPMARSMPPRCSTMSSPAS
jgi:hypothetical protein